MEFLGGAVPLTSLPFPSPFDAQTGLFFLDILYLQQGQLFSGHIEQNIQKQINLVESLSLQKGSHSLKFGIDFRRLSPEANPQAYLQDALFRNVMNPGNGNLFFGFFASPVNLTFLFPQPALSAHDTSPSFPP